LAHSPARPRPLSRPTTFHSRRRSDETCPLGRRGRLPWRSRHV
jgi:hypothetical protein